ncbi:MAG: choice-of-anchor D domain-containing protein, partial [Myxococcales bacterium]
VVPPAVRFGYVENGRYKTLSFHVRNTSQNACIVSTLELGRGSSPEITLPKPIALPATILPGGTLEVPVRLSPKVNAEYQGTVEFAINSLHFPQASVGVSGTSKDGCLLVAPNDIDFGVNKVNCSSRERTFTVYNTCATTVNLSGIDVQAGLSNEFRVTQRPVLPYALTSGSSVEFKAVYRPTDVGTDAGSIAVQTLQLSHPYVVSVSGTGATDAVQTDIFAQDARPKMDILFVVDDSGSMSDKQTSLGANFDAFMKYAQSQGVDFHIAVTSTSVCTSNTCGSSKASNGRFAPEQPLDFPSPAERVITPTSANASQLFSRNVNVGTSGNGDEQALEAAARALSQNRLGNHNAGFLRPDAYLAIVFVTDTYDQSPQTTAYYYNYFLSVVGFRRANELSISGIIPTSAGPTSTCSYDETTASMQSTRLRNIITQSGGLFDNICTPDWSKTLEAIGQRIFGYKTRFFLTNTPDLSPTVEPMRVYVNNVERPATGPQGDVRWTYDSVTNSINFDPLAAPEPGDTLKVVYTVACVP